MAEQARIRTLLLTKSHGHFCVGDVINLMGSGLEQKRIHDAGHVAGNAAATFGVGEMVGVFGRHGLALESSVASYAHKIRPVLEFQRCRVRGRITFRLFMRVRRVASATTRLSFPEAL